MFENRKDAGNKLAIELEKYRNENPLILAIPRGGAEIGYRVALFLDAEFSIIVVRKLPFPDNPEAGFGAIAEDGSIFIFKRAEYWLEAEDIYRVEKEQIEEIERRMQVLRGGKPLPDIEGRTVILTDDGIAMGSTMRAAIMLCRKRNAGKVVVASPVAGKEVSMQLEEIADDVVILEIPLEFRAVADSYESWYNVSDEEVLEIMRQMTVQ